MQEMTLPAKTRNGWLPATSNLWNVVTRTTSHVNTLFGIQKRNGVITTPERRPHITGWGQDMLNALSIRTEVSGDPRAHTPALYVGNHVSYIDIPLLMSVAPVVFIAKKQLAKWPIFGRAMRSVGTVFVDRDSRASRTKAAEQVAPRILEHKQSVAVFPSGTTTVDETKPWRFGVFVIAKRYGLPIVPFRLRYSPLRTAAFIGDDAFVPHLWRVAQHGSITAEVEFGEPLSVESPEKTAKELWQWSKAFVQPKPA